LNHLFKDSVSLLISFLKLSRVELVNIIQQSSANKIGSDFLSIHFDKSFM